MPGNDGAAGHQPATADRRQQDVDIGLLLEQFERGSALPANDVFVVIGVDRHHAPFHQPGKALFSRLLAGGAEAHLAAMTADVVNLCADAVIRHHHDGLPAVQRGRGSQCSPMVTG